MQKKISVIVVANNNLNSLEKVIWSYNTQAFRNFEMIIVNQNYSETISKSITYIQKEVFFPIVIMDFEKGDKVDHCIKKAIEKAITNYILITNADCLARPDFVEQHIKNRVEGSFLNGGSNAVSKSISDAISKEIVYASDCFRFNWLRTNGLNFFNSLLISHSGLWCTILDVLLGNKDISNDNLSGWKSDFMQLKSFDNLIELGVKQKNIKFSSILIKLTSK